MRARLLFLAAGSMYGLACAPILPAQEPAGPTVQILSFGTTANDPSVNSRAAFQAALAALAETGGGTLHIAAGQYYLDFPDIASNVDPAIATNGPLIVAENLTAAKLILVPANVHLVGDVDATGNPTTQIHWKTSGFPIFSFANSSNSSMSNVEFIYDGVLPQFFPWTQERFLAAIGINAAAIAPFYEMSTVIYTISSDGLSFENLTFTSSTSDNEHTFAFGIVTKGKNPVVPPTNAVVAGLSYGSQTPGGGMTGCSTGNTFENLRFSNFVMGILASGQCNPVFEDISGNNRGSWYQSYDPTHEPVPGTITNIGPPGHLIYLTFQQVDNITRTAAQPSGELVFASTVRNTDITMNNISEGAETLSNFNSLGTLALKSIDGGVINGVISMHPAGLIVSMVDTHNLTLENLSWTSSRNLCLEPGSTQNCYFSAINIIPGDGDPSTQINDHLTFSNVALTSFSWSAVFEVSSPTNVALLSHDITADNIQIETPMLWDVGQGGPKGAITLLAANTNFTNVTYTPVIPPGGEVPTVDFNYAVIIRPNSLNTTVQIGLVRVAGIPETSWIYRTVLPNPPAGDAIVSNFVN